MSPTSECGQGLRRVGTKFGDEGPYRQGYRILLGFSGAPCHVTATYYTRQMVAVPLNAREGAEYQSFPKFLLARELIKPLGGVERYVSIFSFLQRRSTEVKHSIISNESSGARPNC